jgi:hypothetical protein
LALMAPSPPILIWFSFPPSLFDHGC